MTESNIFRNKRILITGASGFFGKNLVKVLSDFGYLFLLTPTRAELNLLEMSSVSQWFKFNKPDIVIHLAGFVRGIQGNINNQAKAFYENSLMSLNLIEASRLEAVERFLAMGTVAVYPDHIRDRAFTEIDIFSGIPHASEIGYAFAKRNMLAHLFAYKKSYGLNSTFIVSTNLFGPHDNFDTEEGHVIPSLIKKFYLAKKNNTNIEVWGDGSQTRDFLYIIDAANAVERLLHQDFDVVNLATGTLTSIESVVNTLVNHTKFDLKINWNVSKPIGQRNRHYNIEKMHSIGFKLSQNFDQALKETYNWYELNGERNL